MFQQLLPFIVHIHVKDAVKYHSSDNSTAKMAFLPIGLGAVDWRAHFAAIKSSGYNGILSLETRWRREPTDEKLLPLPADHAFSKGGVEASLACFHNIQALWDQLPPP